MICHPKRSEGSVPDEGPRILRFAQDDNDALQSRGPRCRRTSLPELAPRKPLCPGPLVVQNSAGAEAGIRTPTPSRGADFKSAASADFATPAAMSQAPQILS